MLASIAVNSFTELGSNVFKYIVGAGGVITLTLGGKLLQIDILSMMLSTSGKVQKTVKVLLLVPLVLSPLLGKVLKLVELL